MATPAHCLYCFDVLHSSLRHDAPPLTLHQTMLLWDEFSTDKLSQTITLPDKSEANPPTPTTITNDPATTSSVHLAVPLPRSSSASTSTSTSTSTPTSSSSSTSLSTASSIQSAFSTAALTRSTTSFPSASSSHPLFVTWNTISPTGTKALRGCIGTFQPSPLSTSLSTYALHASLSDPRFPPIPLSLLPRLECAVTLLTTFEPCSDPLDWQIGTHGIRVEFDRHSRPYSGCYLPDVCLEQGWDQQEAIDNVVRKAGWRGDWRRLKDLKVERFQGNRITVGYREWKEWRNWVSERD